MANRRSSIKKIRIDKKRVFVNQRVKSELKTVTRDITELLQNKKTAELKTGASLLFSKLDKAVKKHLIHANRAARLKSRVQRKINSLTASLKKSK